VVVSDEYFEVSAVFLEVVVDALEDEQFPDEQGVDGLDVSVGNDQVESGTSGV